MTFEQKLEDIICSGVSQKEIAECAGLSTMTISNIWNGKSKPNKKTRIKIENAIDELKKKRG